MARYLGIVAVCLLAAVSANNDVYIFNNGNCPNNNCCDGLTCSCDESQIMQIVNNNTQPTTTATPAPTVINANDLSAKESVGSGPDENPLSCTKCDHKPNWMAVYYKPFSIDGVIYEVSWLMNNDCGDNSDQSIKYGTVNKKIIFGIAEPVNLSGCEFKIIGYITKNRIGDNQWDGFLKTQTTASPQATLKRTVTLTQADHVAMGLTTVDALGNFNLKGKHFVYAYLDGGCVCYQQWQDVFTTGQVMHCMGAAQGNLVDNVGGVVNLSAETKLRRKYRHYGLVARAGQY